MKFIYLILVVLLILISGCVKTPTANVVIEDVEPEEIELEIEPEEEIEEAVEEIEEAVEEPEEIPEEKPAEEEAEPKEKIEIIEIIDKKFIPDKLTVNKGTTVVWKHNDKYRGNENIIHMIRIYPIGDRSDRLEYGDSFNYTFTEANNYWYIDIIFKEDMTGEITVK